MAERAQIVVKGVVQGVGFRPYVYTLADSLHLRGYVTNTPEGVIIEVEGDGLREFIERLPRESPPLSRVIDITISLLPVYGYPDFRILESKDRDSKAPFTLVSPDVSICDDCLKELLDPLNRRYLYPFINCTNCGPRYSITKAVPYDRPNTTMAVFSLCTECSDEYHNPKDRRFHAQPNACPRCGPQVTLVDGKQVPVICRDPLQKTIELLKEGKIIAIRGLGGFHIACDANQEATVERLRELKRRSNKPFGLMAPDIETIEKFCEVSEEEKRLLLSNRRPIVLLRKREGMHRCLPDAVSPRNRYLGFMLPYTPLHYLLFTYPEIEDSTHGTAHFDALVMTSGNMSEEPIVRDNHEALEKLSIIADAVLLHNRDIFMRVDDSVIRAGEGHSPFFIRRSRGYTPEPIMLPSPGPEVMGCGADIKNTFTITKGGFAIPSQHIGDMENYETLEFFEESLENLKRMYRARPVAIGHDLHPGYLSTQWALRQDLPAFPFQHHYAHVGSVMAEHGLDRKVIGVAFDGTGYGIDGNLWGGEFLVADLKGFERAGHLRSIPLPGGEMAIREPWRTAVSYLLDAAGDEAMDYLRAIGFTERYGKETLEKIITIRHAEDLSPLSSGAGRLFDAVSALIGLCDRNTFEGEAAMALESLITGETDDHYSVTLTADASLVVDFSPAVMEIVHDVLHGRTRREISMKFHNTVSNGILEAVTRISETSGVKHIVLSGGTFQNVYLLKRTTDMLTSRGMNVHTNQLVPCNDACISLGQAFLVRERIMAGEFSV